jgi:hypothetical protein
MKPYLLFLVLLLTPHFATAQSNEALEACRGLNPPVAWRECIATQEARLREMRESPQYQAEQKRHAEELRLRAQEIENQQRMIEELERQRIYPPRRSVNCESRRVGNTVQTFCN